MSIKYGSIQKINPRKPTDPPKYYASVATQGKVTLRVLAKEIAEVSTVSIADVTAAAKAILQVIQRHNIRQRSFLLASLAPCRYASPAKERLPRKISLPG